MSVSIVLVTAAIEVLSLLKMEGFTIQTVLVYYAFLLPVIFGFYIYSIAVLFKTMNHKQNPALLPEYKKMKWQSAYFVLSMSVFYTAHMVILIKQITEIYDVLLILLGTSIVTDLMPMGYVIYCHRRSFRRVQLFYDDM